MPMFNDIDWPKNEKSSVCASNAREVSDYATESQRGHWSFLGPGDEEKWYRTCHYKPEGKWDQHAIQNDCCIRTEWSSRVPRYQCAQLRNTEAKIRTKHYSLHSGLRKR